MPHISHNGLRLPLFSEHEVVWDAGALDDRLKAARKTQQTHLVRFARLNPHTRLGLAKTLDLADKLFALAATTCHTEVVEHHWGLARIPEALSQQRTGELIHSHPALPVGMSLVARVAVLQPLPKAGLTDVYERAAVTTEIYDRLEADLVHFTNKAVRQYGALWADGTIHQFMLHVPPGAAARLALVDIEPNILVQNANTGGQTPRIG